MASKMAATIFCGNFAETIRYRAILDVYGYIFVVKESIYTIGLIVTKLNVKINENE